ncbi:F-box/FBD/LRR-repeat protein At1g16930-like, partial [Papaver somniferum]|uniref:F-box/FBD/LRR-repeat protein At1g16930-like n=1 Tax=Papaver somniferum TaxID=3469 RepID=UPI000E6FA39D
NIDKFSLACDPHLKESRVRSWLSNLIRGNVKELSLKLIQDGDHPLFIPLSLFTCESLISLELNTYPSIRLPKYINFPSLKRLELSKFDCSSECWNEELFSNSPVLEELILKFGIFSMRNFSISIPTLRLLKIDTSKNVLQDCVFKMDAPRLVSFTYWGSEAKEFVLSSFLVLVKADVCFYFDEEFDSPEERRRVLFSLAHVKCLIVCNRTLQAICPRYYESNYLPTFYNVKMLNISDVINTDEGLIALLKAAPNLESLVFEMHMEDETTDSYDNENEGDAADVAECGSNDECEDNYDEKDYSSLLGIVTTGCMFLHLKSVCFQAFTGKPT